MEFKRIISGKESVESRLGIINSFRAAESLRLGLRRILRLADRFKQMKGLTILAEEYIKAVASLAKEQIGETHETPGNVKWTLVAAGKLGRREMNFGSDLDLLVFYEKTKNDAGALSANDYVTLLVQSIIKLSGTMTPLGDGYQVDMRLRPEGDAGPLVVSYDAMIDYYDNRGQVWERLALVGARSITGDEKFGMKVMAALTSFIESSKVPGLKPADSEKIMAIRERIANERVKPGVLDIKFGRGGLMEIEFICQWLAMENSESPKGDKPFTISILKTARKKRWLEKDVADDLIKAYLFYRSLEDTLRMDKEKAVNVIPVSDAILLNRLSRAIEEATGGGKKLIEDIKETMRKVQDIYLKFFEFRAKPK
jgi:glutamate-ammonia-ligase adenylyltransferase